MPSQEDLKRTMQSKTDEELYSLLHLHSQDYTLEATNAASEEFSRRQPDAPTISRVVAAAEKREKDQKAPLSWGLRAAAFFVSSAFLFIPVLLAHRHFVEKGERRKAREWARAAIYGFVFYCALGILIRLLG